LGDSEKLLSQSEEKQREDETQKVEGDDVVPEGDERAVVLLQESIRRYANLHSFFFFLSFFIYLKIKI
jgi:hypothetical protein